MLLDFKRLAAETNNPLPDRGEAYKQRHRVIQELSELGLGNRFLAQTCLVEEQTVKRWREDGPIRGYRSRIAIDRLGAIIEHMRTDLGLSNLAVLRFATTEPTRTSEERGLELDIQWTPGYERACRRPLLTRIGGHDDIERLEERLRLRFPERYAEILPNIVTSPEEEYAVLHQNDFREQSYIEI